MTDDSDPSMVTPLKESTIRAAMRQAASVAEHRRIRERADAFSRGVGSYRAKVETVIGDLTQWAYARGSGRATWHSGVAAHKCRVALTMLLTNFVYHMRELD